MWLLLLNKICKVPYFNTSLFRSWSNNQRVIFTNQSTTNLFVSFEGLVTSVDTALEPSCGLTSFNLGPVLHGHAPVNGDLLDDHEVYHAQHMSRFLKDGGFSSTTRGQRYIARNY